MNIRYSDYTDGNKNMEPIAPLGKGDRRTNLHNQISQALAKACCETPMFNLAVESQ
jgi:hypothetical protein